jgi:hypothetical protein
LVNADYSILVPLPVKRKLGISYISQPKFTQQLGVFSKIAQDEQTLKFCLDEIHKRYPKIYLQLNIENNISSMELRKRLTYCLELNKSYDDIFNNYNTHHKRNLSKAKETGLEKNSNPVISNDIDSFISNFKITVGLKDKSLTSKDYSLMHKIITAYPGRMIVCRNYEGEIMSGLFYMESKTKLINLFNFTTPSGKENKSMYLLLNFWIESFSNRNLTLDFEGSEIKSIARFYSGFGASERNYQIFTKKGFWQM